MNQEETQVYSDDEISLPTDTMYILEQFLKEKEEREKHEQEMLITANGTKDMSFEEDWQLSQFWYNDETKADFSKLCEKLANEDSKIALLSCPSLYPSIKDVHDNVRIFEFDNRFAAFGDDFVLYDYNEAFDREYLQEYKNYFDIIIADPPFLSEECIEKVSAIIKNIAKDDNTKIIFCTGESVRDSVERFLNLKRCRYEPKHHRNLGNIFASFSNFNLDDCI